jgi:hypothetical protein
MMMQAGASIIIVHIASAARQQQKMASRYLVIDC